MKIQQIQSQQAFGMALHMPPKETIAKHIGTYAAEQAEIARKPLENLAKDVDIYVKPGQNLGHDVRYNKFNIYVTKLQNTEKSSFFSKIFGHKKNLNNIPNANDSISICRDSAEKPLSKRIVELAEDLKQGFLKYSK